MTEDARSEEEMDREVMARNENHHTEVQVFISPQASSLFFAITNSLGLMALTSIPGAKARRPLQTIKNCQFGVVKRHYPIKLKKGDELAFAYGSINFPQHAINIEVELTCDFDPANPEDGYWYPIKAAIYIQGKLKKEFNQQGLSKLQF